MRAETICFSDLHISPKTVEGVGKVLTAIVEDILDRKPGAIICTGDIGEFSSHNRKSTEFKTADTNVEKKAVKDCLCNYLFKPIADYNNSKRALKKKLYRPDFFFLMGNHDKLEFHWYQKLFAEIAKRLHCRIDVNDEETVLNFDDNIFFKHTFMKGISGTPHTSCAGVLKDLHASCIHGHRHVREVAEDRDLKGNKITCICLPCATPYRPDWACESAQKWDTGWLRLSFDISGIKHYEFMEYEGDLEND